MTVFWTSDPHFWHANVIVYCKRPWWKPNGDPDVEKMNEMLVMNWNKTVGPDDTVICLGDFSLAMRPVETFTPRLNGKKKLVPGNHDWCHPANKKARGDKLAKQIQIYESHGWEVLPIFSEYDIEGVARVNLCHMPYKGDSTDERYQDFRLKNDGRWLICGHVHERWTKRGKMINVGVDRHDYTPIPTSRIVEIMNTEGDL